MIEELGKWLLDISKYIITGYVIAKMLGKDDSALILMLAVLVAAILAVLGFYLIKKGKDTTNKNKKGK